MSRDEKIEEILNYFYKEHIVTLGDYIYSEFGDSNDMDNRKECDVIIDFMVQKELISVGDCNSKILPNGINIAENGGWLKYLERKFKKDIEEEKRKSNEFEKIELEIKLLKRKIKNYRLFVGISIIGSIISMATLIWHIVEKK